MLVKQEREGCLKPKNKKLVEQEEVKKGSKGW
jgi:hypothetical protein